MSRMPFNDASDEKWLTPIKRGDIAGAIIKTSNALAHIVIALTKLKNGDKDIQSQIDVIAEKSNDLTGIFDEMTGWVDE